MMDKCPGAKVQDGSARNRRATQIKIAGIIGVNRNLQKQKAAYLFLYYASGYKIKQEHDASILLLFL